jgi:small-conductance mechanosensitive channel
MLNQTMLAMFLDHTISDWRNWAWASGLSVGVVLVALIAHRIVLKFARRIFHKQQGAGALVVRYAAAPLRLILPLVGLLLLFPLLPLPAYVIQPVSHTLGIFLIAAITWFLIAALDFIQDYITLHHAIEMADNLAARRVRTQVQLLRHVAASVIVMLGLAIILMTFPSIRHLGESLFASAGVAALVAGLAARTTLTNLLAGVQIALTQPIRLEDVVVVEGEWGWIEEITMTYVIVRIWDLRRLVLPLSYFIEKPFQNWTRRTANLLGTAFFYMDYSVPVEEVRQELLSILQSSPLWDKRVWGLQVTNTTDRAVELRALMSAADGPKAFDLRCYVREKMLHFLQEKYPESLPRVRAELEQVRGSGLRAEEAGEKVA